MKLIRHSDPEKFNRDVEECIGADRVAGNILIGRARYFVEHGIGAGQIFIVQDDSRPVLAACMLSGHAPVMLSDGPLAAALLVLDDIATSGTLIHGISASAKLADGLLPVLPRYHWSVTDQRTLTLHRLHAPVNHDSTLGQLRQLTESDLAWFEPWFMQFCQDVREPMAPIQQRLVARLKITSGDVWALEIDNQPVSLTAITRVADDLVRISLVFTPVHQRRRGYAEAAVKALCHRLRASRTPEGGNHEILLYADDYNPTATQLYRRIGFFPVTGHRDIFLTTNKTEIP